jgi:acyl-CoA-binding protein
MDLTVEFNQAVNEVQQLTARPAIDELLKLYGLFKQATEGDNNAPRPGGFDFKAMAKFDSWANHKGKTRDEAMKDYIDFVATLLSKYA